MLLLLSIMIKMQAWALKGVSEGVVNDDEEKLPVRFRFDGGVDSGGGCS